MKIRNITENYEDLPDEDEFQDWSCSICGGEDDEYGLYECEGCNSLFCSNCMQTGAAKTQNEGDLMTPAEREASFPRWLGEIMKCVNCRTDLTESYENLPDKDEFRNRQEAGWVGPIIIGPYSINGWQTGDPRDPLDIEVEGAVDPKRVVKAIIKQHPNLKETIAYIIDNHSGWDDEIDWDAVLCDAAQHLF
jgi:hypothetical protein